jgi:ribosomal-protein-alanine N-acetyltransferase
MKNILFICSGNTCRSPLAAELMEMRLAARGVTGVKCSSAGLTAVPGEPASPNAVLAAREVGADLSGHRARKVTSELLRQSDVIVALDPAHKAVIVSAFPSLEPKVKLLGKGISDPYGGSLGIYRRCRDEMMSALGGLIDELGLEGGSGFEIARMAQNDIASIADIEKLCFSSPWTEEMLQEELGNPIAVFLAARSAGRVAGYAGMTVVVGEGYIANIAVHPEFRRRGCATALLGALCGYAEKNGLELLTLEVRSGNAAAIKIYEKAGFARVGVRPGFYSKPREDALIMTRVFKKSKQK